MSSRVIAKILPMIKDLKIFKEVLDTNNYVYNWTEKVITLTSDHVHFDLLDNGSIKARFNSNNVKANKVIKDIINHYNDLYEKKLAELKRQLDASNREMELAEKSIQNEKMDETKVLDREIRKMEKIKSIEQKLLREEIKKVEKKILDRAKANGYIVQKSTINQKQVLILVRRK